jgi:hypothetical protein
MLDRCRNLKNKRWNDYGGRGIRVHESWLNFENFYRDMGARPNGSSLDRYPNQNGNYEPGNCRWATRKQQQRNMRSNVVVEWNGIKATVIEWCERTGIPEKALRSRLRRGWSTERALTQRCVERTRAAG